MPSPGRGRCRTVARDGRITSIKTETAIPVRHILITVFDGVLASGISGVIDLFAAANRLWGDASKDGRAAPLFAWRVESLDGKPVRSASGQLVGVDGAIDIRGPAVDAVIVPGPFVSDMARFLDRMSSLQTLNQAIRRQHQSGALLASYCSGSFLLAEAGLLDGRAATTHWALERTFRQRYPNVDLQPAEIITEQNRILCSGAVTTYFNLALRIVEKFGGARLATLVGKLLLIDTSRVSQASFATLTLQDKQPHGDPVVARGQRWLEKHLHENVRLADLAGYLALSERTINRRFRRALGEAPLQHLQTLRVEIAKRLLETSRLGIDAVAGRVGYQDIGTFRRLFRRGTGLSPREYRRGHSRGKTGRATSLPASR